MTFALLSCGLRLTIVLYSNLNKLRAFSSAKSTLFDIQSMTSGRSRCIKSSASSGRTRGSVSSASRLIQARTKVASLKVRAAFLKEKQALKMASEELELKEKLAQAREEEKILEQLNGEESTPKSELDLQYPSRSNLLPHRTSKSLMISSKSHLLLHQVAHLVKI